MFNVSLKPMNNYLRCHNIQIYIVKYTLKFVKFIIGRVQRFAVFVCKRDANSLHGRILGLKHMCRLYLKSEKSFDMIIQLLKRVLHMTVIYAGIRH